MTPWRWLHRRYYQLKAQEYFRELFYPASMAYDGTAVDPCIPFHDSHNPELAACYLLHTELKQLNPERILVLGAGVWAVVCADAMLRYNPTGRVTLIETNTADAHAFEHNLPEPLRKVVAIRSSKLEHVTLVKLEHEWDAIVHQHGRSLSIKGDVTRLP